MALNRTFNGFVHQSVTHFDCVWGVLWREEEVEEEGVEEDGRPPWDDCGMLLGYCRVPALCSWLGVAYE